MVTSTFPSFFIKVCTELTTGVRHNGDRVPPLTVLKFHSCGFDVGIVCQQPAAVQGFSPSLVKHSQKCNPSLENVFLHCSITLTCFQSKCSLQISLRRKLKERLLTVVVCSDLELECGTENCQIWPVLRKRQRWHTSNSAKQIICAKYFLVHPHSSFPAKKLARQFFLTG